jgi:hypothetical protein
MGWRIVSNASSQSVHGPLTALSMERAHDVYKRVGGLYRNVQRKVIMQKAYKMRMDTIEVVDGHYADDTYKTSTEVVCKSPIKLR